MIELELRVRQLRDQLAAHDDRAVLHVDRLDLPARWRIHHRRPQRRDPAADLDDVVEPASLDAGRRDARAIDVEAAFVTRSENESDATDDTSHDATHDQPATPPRARRERAIHRRRVRLVRLGSRFVHERLCSNSSAFGRA